MISYETAKKLKDEGFKQFGEGRLAPTPEGLSEKDIAYIPTLEELIEACGENVRLEVTDKTLSTATKLMPMDGANMEAEGSTPSESVASLWLKLNEK